jgi:hypothetical protein
MTDDQIRQEFDDIRSVLAETAIIQREHARVMLTHAKSIADAGERLDRIGRKLKALTDIGDGMIRDKGKRKKD